MSNDNHEEEEDVATKINCGIWVTLDLILSKKESNTIWDKYEPIFGRPKKKDRARGRIVSSAIKTTSPVASPPAVVSKTTAQSSPLLLLDPHNPKTSSANKEQRKIRAKSVPSKRVGTTKSAQRSISRTSNTDGAAEVHPIRNNLTADGEAGEGYVNPLIECSFNFPRVCAQLERLMGTNVVRLTDRKYMTDLRRRIQEDFKQMQDKRIDTRERHEDEREQNLILKGRYTPDNCPSYLLNVHSIALAQEMERQRNLIMQDMTVKCPPEYDLHPVFITNQSTNQVISYRRSKMKTQKERKDDLLLRKGAKWESEKFKYAEIDRQLDTERKEKQERAAKEVEDYAESNRIRGTDLIRIKNRDYTECEFEMKWFLDAERDRMLKKRPIKMLKQPTTVINDKCDVNDTAAAEMIHHLNLAATQNEPQKECQATDEYDSLCSFKSTIGQNDVVVEVLNEEQHKELLKKQRDEALKSGFMVEKVEFEKLYYEDPRVTNLKQTETVKEMYEMADKIIYGLYDLKNRKPPSEETVEKEDEERSDDLNDVMSLETSTKPT